MSALPSVQVGDSGGGAASLPYPHTAELEYLAAIVRELRGLREEVKSLRTIAAPEDSTQAGRGSSLPACVEHPVISSPLAALVPESAVLAAVPEAQRARKPRAGWPKGKPRKSRS